MERPALVGQTQDVLNYITHLETLKTKAETADRRYELLRQTMGLPVGTSSGGVLDEVMKRIGDPQHDSLGAAINALRGHLTGATDHMTLTGVVNVAINQIRTLRAESSSDRQLKDELALLREEIKHDHPGITDQTRFASVVALAKEDYIRLRVDNRSLADNIATKGRELLRLTEARSKYHQAFMHALGYDGSENPTWDMLVDKARDFAMSFRISEKTRRDVSEAAGLAGVWTWDYIIDHIRRNIVTRGDREAADQLAALIGLKGGETFEYMVRETLRLFADIGEAVQAPKGTNAADIASRVRVNMLRERQTYLRPLREALGVDTFTEDELLGEVKAIRAAEAKSRAELGEWVQWKAKLAETAGCHPTTSRDDIMWTVAKFRDFRERVVKAVNA